LGYVTEKVGLENRVGKLATIFPDKNYTNGLKYIHEYVGDYVRKTIEQHKKYTALVQKTEWRSKYVFLEELAKMGYGKKKIQDELLNILIAGRDTTAGLLAHLWYILARRPEVFEKLRAEVLSLGNRKPSFEQVKEMKYLQYCVNEGQSPLILFIPLSNSL
jgi:cytochrome P450